jgi:hypothetical protein
VTIAEGTRLHGMGTTRRRVGGAAGQGSVASRQCGGSGVVGINVCANAGASPGSLVGVLESGPDPWCPYMGPDLARAERMSAGQASAVGIAVVWCHRPRRR